MWYTSQSYVIHITILCDAHHNPMWYTSQSYVIHITILCDTHHNPVWCTSQSCVMHITILCDTYHNPVWYISQCDRTTVHDSSNEVSADSTFPETITVNEKCWWLLYLAVFKISQLSKDLIWRYYWKQVAEVHIFFIWGLLILAKFINSTISPNKSWPIIYCFTVLIVGQRSGGSTL